MKMSLRSTASMTSTPTQRIPMQPFFPSSALPYRNAILPTPSTCQINLPAVINRQNIPRILAFLYPSSFSFRFNLSPLHYFQGYRLNQDLKEINKTLVRPFFRHNYLPVLLSSLCEIDAIWSVVCAYSLSEIASAHRALVVLSSFCQAIRLVPLFSGGSHFRPPLKH